MYKMPYMMYQNPYCCSSYGMDFTKSTLERSLKLVKEAIAGEREDELFYDYLISEAPTKEQKDIITSIRNDEIKHRKLFRQIYKAFTGMDVGEVSGEEFQKPKSYIDGIKRALFNELKAMEKYRIIRQGLPSRCYRDVVFEILTDEIKHAIKYNYILTLNLSKKDKKKDMCERLDCNEMRSIMW